jgi:hypothetical protein
VFICGQIAFFSSLPGDPVAAVHRHFLARAALNAAALIEVS